MKSKAPVPVYLMWAAINIKNGHSYYGLLFSDLREKSKKKRETTLDGL